MVHLKKEKWILYHHRQTGDCLVMSTLVCQIKRLLGNEIEILCDTPICPEIWLNNPLVSDFKTRADRIFRLDYRHVIDNPQWQLHHSYGFKIDFESQSGINLPEWDCRPDIYLNDFELNIVKDFKNKYGDYWVIAPSNKENCRVKLWLQQYWEKVIKSFPNINFVQVGEKPFNYINLQKCNNVIDYTDKTGIRDLFAIVYGSSGVISYNSLLMHIAAAFNKKAVILGGGREPIWYQQYKNQYVFNMANIMDCSNGGDGCLETVCDSVIPKCMEFIKPKYVIDVMEGFLNKPKRQSVPYNASLIAKTKPIFYMVCNTASYNGGERTAIEIMKMMQDEYEVNLLPLQTRVNYEFRKLENIYIWDRKYLEIFQRDVDILFFLVNDSVMRYEKNEYKLDWLDKIKAQRKIICLNYTAQGFHKYNFLQNWDTYICQANFLQENLVHRLPIYQNIEIIRLLPPANLKPFLEKKYKRNYDTLRLVRHSSQGMKKYYDDHSKQITRIGKIRDCYITLMPTPALWAVEFPVRQFNTYNNIAVIDFLKKGNLFWYMVDPNKHRCVGENVVLEAMASGLPVLCNNNFGLNDIVTKDTGWVCKNLDEMYNIIKNITMEELQEKGRNAKKWIIKNHDPKRWKQVIINN